MAKEERVDCQCVGCVMCKGRPCTRKATSPFTNEKSGAGCYWCAESWIGPIAMRLGFGR